MLTERSASDITANKHCHLFALLLNDIPDRFPHILILASPSGAAMALPALSIGSIAPWPIQSPAGIGLEIVLDFLGLRGRSAGACIAQALALCKSGLRHSADLELRQQQ